MKMPADFKIVGNRVTLIPYAPAHVEKYHGWMEEPEILRLTGSERLTLEQEYEMQQEWERDEHKCTFIIMDNSKYEQCKTELSSIVGDTNLFFQDDPSEAEIEVMIAETWARRKGLAKEALEMMIRYGTPVPVRARVLWLLLFFLNISTANFLPPGFSEFYLTLGRETLKKTVFIAKIKVDNLGSIALFEKIGFVKVSESKVFQEYTMELRTPMTESM